MGVGEGQAWESAREVAGSCFPGIPPLLDNVGKLQAGEYYLGRVLTCERKGGCSGFPVVDFILNHFISKLLFPADLVCCR